MNRLLQRLLRRLKVPLLICIAAWMAPQVVDAQQKPPKPISVTVSKEYDLNFGTFCAGNGQSTTVIIDPNGSRSKTGNIILLGSSSWSAARYDVSALPGTYINLMFQDAELTGPNQATITLQVGGSNPPSPFVATGEHTTVTIGGTLIVGASGVTPSGNYNGEFYVTFIQE